MTHSQEGACTTAGEHELASVSDVRGSGTPAVLATASCTSCEAASLVRVRGGRRLLISLVGNSIYVPFLETNWTTRTNFL